MHDVVKVLYQDVQQVLNIGGRSVVLQTGKMARQALGSVWVCDGDARILCTVTVGHVPVVGDFCPLSVHYIEKAYAVGKIPGGFIKRESKPTDHEILVSRLIDRMLRPLFPSDFHYETQVVCTVVSGDPEADLAIDAMIGASAALSLSGLPFAGPAAAIRLGHDGQGWVWNADARRVSPYMDLVVAGTAEGTVMVECHANERDEAFMVEALTCAHDALVPIVQGIDRLVQQAGKPAFVYAHHAETLAAVRQRIDEETADHWADVLALRDRQGRGKKLADLGHQVEQALIAGEGYDAAMVKSLFFKAWRDQVRAFILKNRVRLDGRQCDEVRPIHCQVGVLPKSHGSALFTRGDTQALVSVTMGTRDDAQVVDGLDGMFRDTFLLHYNFPSFSVGEVGKMSGPGRREIGHGRLAWRALRSLMSQAGCSHTVRVVSEILESYGSSSMATVCGASLALMNAGIRLPRPVAGIAMGLIQGDQQEALLSDITGLEDAMGDMDFKVAGTAQGITAFQMDLKGQALDRAFLERALRQACQGLVWILNCMSVETLEQPQGLDADGNLRPGHTPAVLETQIPEDKIRDLIGPGGRVIKDLCETTGCKIDIGDEGRITIFAPDGAAGQRAIDRIRQLMSVPEEGKVYEGQVTKVMDFGAFIHFGFAQDGLVHISEISGERIANIHDVITAGDAVRVRVLGFDRGRAKLTMRPEEPIQTPDPNQTLSVDGGALSLGSGGGSGLAETSDPEKLWGGRTKTTAPT